MTPEAQIKMRARLLWLQDACDKLTFDHGLRLRTWANRVAVAFDIFASKIHPSADAMRRELFVLSVMKEYLEQVAGGGHNAEEASHRNRLCNQTREDYLQMSVNADYPSADIVVV